MEIKVAIFEDNKTLRESLEQLINNGVLDKELGLSYATNRTNLALRLETQGSGAQEAGPAIEAKPARPSAPASRPPTPRSELDDLIER